METVILDSEKLEGLKIYSQLVNSSGDSDGLLFFNMNLLSRLIKVLGERAKMMKEKNKSSKEESLNEENAGNKLKGTREEKIKAMEASLRTMKILHEQFARLLVGMKLLKGKLNFTVLLEKRVTDSSEASR
jgi:hypothetical protein